MMDPSDLPTHADIIRERGGNLPPGMAAREELAAFRDRNARSEVRQELDMWDRRSAVSAQQWAHATAPRYQRALPTKVNTLTPEGEALVNDIVARALERREVEQMCGTPAAYAAVNRLIEEVGAK